MFCVKCNRHIAYCKCEDINERLSGLGLSPVTKQLALSGIEQRVEQKVRGEIDPNIEFLLNNTDKKVKVSFRSKRHDGIYFMIGKVLDVTPEYIRFFPEETNYPGGTFDCLNTSRMTKAELAV